MKDITINFQNIDFVIREDVVQEALRRLKKGSIESFLNTASEQEIDTFLDECNMIEDEGVLNRIKESGLWGSF